MPMPLSMVHSSRTLEGMILARDRCTCSLTSIYSGGQYELLDWLQNVTFPMEAKFADPKFARRTYTSVVQRVIDNGVGTPTFDVY